MSVLGGLLVVGCEGSAPDRGGAAGPSDKAPADGQGCLKATCSRTDRVLASTNPPGGLAPAEVPQFVALGWDDNGEPAGLRWALDLAKARKNPGDLAVGMTFYNTSDYAAESGELWKEAYDAGHEIGNHTKTHGEKLQQNTDSTVWEGEIASCQDTLQKLGIPATEIYGFRTPFLAHSAATLDAVAKAGFWYDCSLEEGYEDPTGRSYRWPYTLDEGSPGNDLLVEWETKLAVNKEPGLWELPVYALLAPPDADCAAYGIASGFRARLKAKVDWYDADAGHITGFDYNLWSEDEFGLSPDEVLAVLKYTLDQRLAGNHAPFLLGLHTDEYASAEHHPRRRAIEEFLTYALSKEAVRVVPAKSVIDWMRSPKAL